MKSSALERAQAAIKRKAGSGSHLKKKGVFDSQSSDETGDLNQYLSTLRGKTGGTPAPDPRAKLLAGLSDISISSDDEITGQQKKMPIAASKFLKKKPATAQAPAAKVTDPTPKPAPRSTPFGQTQTMESPALLKLSQQTQRMMMKKSGEKVTYEPQKSLMSDSEVSTTDQSIEFGGGNRFLRKKEAEDSSLPSKSKNRKSPDIRRSLTISETISEDDSEKMAAYMRGLQSEGVSEVSEADSLKRGKPTTRKRPPSEKSSFATESFSQSDESIKSESYIQSVTSIKSESSIPESLPGVRNAAPKSSSKHIKTETELPKSPPKSSAPIFSSLGLMTIDDLGQSGTITSSAHERSMDSSIHSEKVYSIGSIGTASYSESIKTQADDSIQTESIKTQPSEVETQSVHSTSRSDTRELSDDETLKETESIKSEQTTPRAYSQYSRSHRSRSESRSTRSYSSRSTYRSRSTSSYTRSISRSSWSSYTSKSRSRSYSRSATRSPSRSRSYSSFSSPSRSVSRSSIRSTKSQSAKHDDRSVSYSESFEQEYSDDFSENSKTESLRNAGATITIESSHKKTPDRPKYRPHLETSDVSIQTGLDLEDMILKYAWASSSTTVPAQSQAEAGQAPSLTQFGISNAALDALTNYNPVGSALNQMVRQQLELTRGFISMQNSLHESILSNIEKEHCYTTLEDTKRYIEENRKPRLTFDEALRQVQKEMGS